jgi:hypothetical protein
MVLVLQTLYTVESGDPSDGSMNSRKAVLRQQSYKLAQQQPVLPPLPGQLTIQQALGLDPRLFRSVVAEDSHLQAHEEEDEEEESVEQLETEARENPWGLRDAVSWNTLPVTLADCKLTDSNNSLSRLSPLLHLNHFQSSVPSSAPTSSLEWEQQSRHLPSTSAIQERMDTSGS